MKVKNRLNLKFLGILENENFARLAVASFCSNLNITLEELADIKTAVSEAVTNSIVHGYENAHGDVEIDCTIFDSHIEIIVKDTGVGIEDIEQAMKPFFTTKPEKERSGMGFTVMEGFMDKVSVESNRNIGTIVTMIKNLKN